MKSWFYWAVATSVLAVVVHLFIVIFVPGVDTGQKMAQLATSGDVNQLHHIEELAAQSVLLTEASPDLAYAYCTYNLTDSTVEIHARVPPSYWSISIYTETADNIYTLNDLQAGVSDINLLVLHEDTDLDVTAGSEARPENTIIVRSPTNTGLILFRAFVGDPSLRESVRGHLSASHCRVHDADAALPTPHDAVVAPDA
jgi:uncharacterized membrane protein